MTDKEKIKEEIKRLSDEYPMSRGLLKHLTKFIDSLSWDSNVENKDSSDECPCCGWLLDSDGCCSSCGYGRK